MSPSTVLALSGLFLGLQAPPAEIPNRVVLEATFRVPEFGGFDFVRFECMGDPKREQQGCWLDEVLLYGCDSGTGQLFSRHYSAEELEVTGSLLRRQIIVRVEGAGVETVFRFTYHPLPYGSFAYTLTDATMKQHDSVKKRDFEWKALRGREATIKLPCAIRANGLVDGKDLP